MCEFCELRDPLDSLAEKWLFDFPVNLSIAQVNFGAVIFPSRKQLDISVVSAPVIDREILTEHININYCPMCGRELIEGEEPMTLERFLGMYDGSCLISVGIMEMRTANLPRISLTSYTCRHCRR